MNLKKKRTTLYLLQKISSYDLNQLEIKVVGPISNTQKIVADTEISYPVRHWQNFYTRFSQSNSGILVKSSNLVSREAHRRAIQIIDQVLMLIPQIAAQMVKESAELAIYGRSEDSYDIPEHRGGSDILGRPVEGFGGCEDNPVTSISEVNVLRITEGPNQTRYLNEYILVHEFAHAIHLVGINQLPDSSLATELVTCYEKAKLKGLWPNTYIISNYEEYFATLSTIWFNVMAESASGIWDGIRGPLNTREEFKQYDPEGYAFFKKIYAPISLSYPWNETPVLFPEILKNIKNGTLHV